MIALLKQAQISKTAARIIGSVVLLLALFGVVCIGVLIADAAAQRGREGERELMATLERFIAPAAAVDLPEFGNIAELDNLSRLRAAACAVIDDGNTLDTAQDGRMRLPVAKLQLKAYQLFGENCKLKYVSFDIKEKLFEYDSEQQEYYFTASGHIDSYEPVIISLVRQRNTYTARVRYVATEDGSGSADSRMMIYTIAEDEGEYTIESVKSEE